MIIISNNRLSKYNLLEKWFIFNYKITILSRMYYKIMHKIHALIKLLII
jgi:hypothetical protein